jgi:hypothetical protein
MTNAQGKARKPDNPLRADFLPLACGAAGTPSPYPLTRRHHWLLPLACGAAGTPSPYPITR